MKNWDGFVRSGDLALNWSNSDYSGWFEWDADARKRIHRDIMGQNWLTMWYLRVCLKMGDHTPQRIRFMEELDDWQYFCLGGCLIFRHSHLSSPKNEGCSKNARKMTTNDVILGYSRYLLSMTCSLLAGKFLFTTFYETRFMNHGLKFVLAVLMAVWLFRVTPLNLDHDQEKRGSATWNVCSSPCNPRFMYFRYLQMGVRPQYVMSRIKDLFDQLKNRGGCSWVCRKLGYFREDLLVNNSKFS